MKSKCLYVVLLFISLLFLCFFVCKTQNSKKQPWLYRIDKYVYEYLHDMGVDSAYVEIGSNGIMLLDLEQSNIDDINILTGLPLDNLNLSKTKIYDIKFLANLTFLNSLNISGTKVDDLSPLINIPLNQLDISQTQIKDLSPIKNMPLKSLSMINTPITNIDVLLTMQIQDLNFSPNFFEDSQLNKLRKMKFRTINMQHDNENFWKDWDNHEGQY